MSDADATNLRTFLADRDTPCPGCGYNLRGLQSEACPECGAELSLTLSARRASISPWSLGLIGLSVSVTLAVVLLLPLIAAFPLLGLADIGLIIGLLIAIREWAINPDRFRVLPRETRRLRLWLCWAVPLLAGLLIVGLVGLGQVLG